MNKKYSNEKELGYNKSNNHHAAELIGAQNGAANGFCMGISIYFSNEYGIPGIHADQEGFFVLEGEGYAQVGGEEFEIAPGTAFIAKAEEPHSVKKKNNSVPVKLLWVHGAI
jgi:mannose-6-phosphate isomerase-like protein (cupin superfamily)